MRCKPCRAAITVVPRLRHRHPASSLRPAFREPAVGDLGLLGPVPVFQPVAREIILVDRPALAALRRSRPQFQIEQLPGMQAGLNPAWSSPFCSMCQTMAASAGHPYGDVIAAWGRHR